MVILLYTATKRHSFWVTTRKKTCW